MHTSFPVGFNPLPWFFIDGAFNRSAAPPLHDIYRQIRSAGFSAVHAEVPEGMSIDEYRGLLEEVQLAPAPGYFQAQFSDASTITPSIELAKRMAAQHAELGLDRIFIADQFSAPRRAAAPGLGAEFDEDRLRTVIDGLGRVSQAMAAEGVLPCLHQHIGTWIETPAETAAVLEAIPAEILLFGPDTGHLAWAGANLAEFIARYADRVGAIHLKDFRRSAVTPGRSYREAIAAHAWTEPGRGDIDFSAIDSALRDFSGWFVVEVDVPDQATAAETAAGCASWVRDCFPTGAPA